MCFVARRRSSRSWEASAAPTVAGGLFPGSLMSVQDALERTCATTWGVSFTALLAQQERAYTGCPMRYICMSARSVAKRLSRRIRRCHRYSINFLNFL
jgi:hypothetical protein